MFFFGPESEKPPPDLPEDPVFSAPSPNESITASRKHPRDVILNGLPEALAAQPAPKRGRKTAPSSERNGSVARKPSASAGRAVNAPPTDVDMVNGHVMPPSDARSPSATEPGPDETAPFMNGVKADERMDVDEESLIVEQQNHEPQVESIPPPSHTLMTGASVGIQVAPAKVANLAHSTAILNLSAPAKSGASRSVTRIAWRPGDNTVLAAMGDDFCGTWDVSNQSPGPVASTRFQELVESTEGKLTSAVAWEPTGDMLAVATYSDQAGDIVLFDGEGFSQLEALTASQRAITCMLWHRQGSRLLGIAPYDSESMESTQSGGSSIVKWNLINFPAVTEPSTVLVSEILMDMDSSFIEDSGVICVAGQNAVYYCRATPELVVEQKWTSDPNASDQWTFIRCAWQKGTNAILVAASAETGSLWMPVQNLLRRGAHDAPITGLELRPRLGNAFSPTSKHELATSSMDGTIKVWRYDEESSSLSLVCKLIIGHGSPVMALAYSPDGFCLAGASYDTVRIWNAEHGHNPMATWKDEQNLWNGLKLKDDDMMSLGGRSSINGDASQASADHTLMWDGESKKLAFGLGSQVTIKTPLEMHPD